MFRSILALAAVIAFGAVGAGPASPDTTMGALVGTVGPGFTITLTKDGAPVTVLPSGDYSLTVTDSATIHDFHIFGPGLDQVVTTVPFTGTVTTTIHLSAGTYTFQCDPHKTIMIGSFTVADNLAPDPSLANAVSNSWPASQGYFATSTAASWAADVSTGKYGTASPYGVGDTSFLPPGKVQFVWSNPNTAEQPELQIISNAPDTLSRWLSRTDAIQVTPGSTYQLSWAPRLFGVNHGYVVVTATFYDSAGEYIPGSAVDSDQLSGTTATWQTLSLSAKAPPTATSMRAELRLFGDGWVGAGAPVVIQLA